MSATVFGGWLGTRRESFAAALAIVWFAISYALVLLVYEALTLLAASVGVLAGTLLACPCASPVKQSLARLFGAWRGGAAAVLALALMLAILLRGGAFVDGSLPFVSVGSKPFELLVFGFALGFGSSVRQSLAPPPESTLEEDRENTRTAVRFLLVVGGAVAGLFVLAFAVYVAIEYAVGPAIRWLAP